MVDLTLGSEVTKYDLLQQMKSTLQILIGKLLFLLCCVTECKLTDIDKCVLQEVIDECLNLYIYSKCYVLK